MNQQHRKSVRTARLVPCDFNIPGRKPPGLQPIQIHVEPLSHPTYLNPVALQMFRSDDDCIAPHKYQRCLQLPATLLPDQRIRSARNRVRHDGEIYG